MIRLLLTLLVLAICGCNVKTEDSKTIGKARNERIKELSYRDMNISDEMRQSIELDISEILKQVTTLDSLQLFYISKTGEIQAIRGKWDNGQQLINQSDQLWTTNNISSTIVIYPSFSQSATTGEIKDLYVIEVENEKLTGTCRMFFDEPNPKHLEKLTYTGRN